MSNPHFDIAITQRSKRKSAVAGAAYQSGEKMFSEYDQKTKNYTHKRGIVYTEIMLPANAPPGHNPHAHIMLTMRAIDERGKWLSSRMLRRRHFLIASLNKSTFLRVAGSGIDIKNFLLSS